MCIYEYENALYNIPYKNLFESGGIIMLKAIQDLFGKSENKGTELELQAFMEGETVSLKEVPDQVFSKKILGKGVAIDPTTEELLSPIDGKVVAVMGRTRHSCCIRGDKGLEILLHIGVNTVEMNGDGFETVRYENTAGFAEMDFDYLYKIISTYGTTHGAQVLQIKQKAYKPNIYTL